MTKGSWIVLPGQYSGNLKGVIIMYEGYMLVLFGVVIVIQQLIIYLMYVRIRQLLQEMDFITGKMRMTDTELENLITRVEEFKHNRI